MKRILLISWLAVLLVACAPVQSVPQAAPQSESSTNNATVVANNLTDGCVETYDPNVDYFPEKVTLTQTKGFAVDYHNNYKVVTVQTPWPGATEGFQYVLVQCGTPAPEGYEATQIINVPIKRIITMSTTYLPFLDKLGVLDRLVGVDDTTYVNNPTVLKMAEEGKLPSIGYGAAVNVEQVLDLAPDIVMTYGSGAPDSDAHPVLLNAGVKVVINAEWMETAPLGRTEWGKFMGLFFNKEASAEALFAGTAQRYTDLVAKAKSAEQHPTVFTDSDYQGTWYVAGGKSFGAQLLADADVDYLWADDPNSASIPLAFEAVFEKAADADFWINVGYYGDLTSLQANDSRYANFAAFKNGNVWNNNKRSNANGGNDYYESAVTEPDVVLADLIAIFHPELMPDHEFVYYQQLK
ncbi:MAG: ABC transporter substrate-binding protein [Caldilineaceae bacterium]